MPRDMDVLRELRDREQERSIAALAQDFRLHEQACNTRTLDLRRRLREVERQLKPKKERPASDGSVSGLLSQFSVARLVLILMILSATLSSQDGAAILGKVAQILSYLK